MVAVLARLKWTLLVRALRTSVWRTAGVVLGALGGLVVASRKARASRDVSSPASARTRWAITRAAST